MVTPQRAAVVVSALTLQTALAHAPLAILVLDYLGNVVMAIGVERGAIGLDSPNIVGRSALDIYRRDPSMLAALRHALDGKAASATREVGERIVEVRCLPLTGRHGAVDGVVGVATDVTERVRAEQALRHQATHDLLTDLPNRTLYNDRLRQALTLTERTGNATTVLMMDLNGFKGVNDTYGHECGDHLVREAGKRLERAMRTSDTIARLGGDEFAAILLNTDGVGAEHVAAQILRAFELPTDIDGRAVLIGISIGAAAFPEQGVDASTLLRHADRAMYEAKRLGGGYRIYHDED